MPEREISRSGRGDDGAAGSAWRRGLGPAVLAALFAALVAWSWRKWTDVQIDFGAELYTAWRLSEGDVLYRDIAYRHGPLSAYANAALFRAFGPSLRVLLVANLAVLAAITTLAYRLLAPSAGRLAAAAACAFFLVVCGFSQYGPIANFNYVTPYQHAQTHGLLLGLAMIAALDTAARRPGRGRAALAGACLGALWLTKAELFAPAAATALAAGFWLMRTGRARVVAACAAPFALAALVPVAAAFAALCAAQPAADAARGVLGNWLYLASAWTDPFYRAGAGLRDVPDSLARIAWAITALAAAVGACAALDLARARRAGRWRVVAPFAALAALGLLFPGRVGDLARALPLTTLAVGVGCAALAARRPEWRERLFAPALLTVFALGLLGKMLLFARFEHYGFALAAPAGWLFVAAWVGALPAVLRERSGGGEVARVLALVLCSAVALAYAQRSERIYAAKTTWVGEGSDAILAERPELQPRAALFERTRRELATRTRAGDSLLVLPEGATLNYWLRKRNPSRYLLFLPPELRAFGEAAVLRDVAAHPPDWIVLAHREAGEFGTGAFGRDPRNGRALAAWVRDHYERVAQFGAEPFTDAGFGTVVLQRRGDAGALHR